MGAMRGALQRCALKQQQQQQLGRCQPLARQALHLQRLVHISRSRIRHVQALKDDPQQEPASAAELQQDLSAAAAGNDQQQVTSSLQLNEQSEASSDSEAEAAVAVALALGDEQAAEEEVLLHQPWEVDHAANKAAATLYTAMAAGLTAAGLAAAVYAQPLAASALKLGGMPLAQAAALVGCVGAGVIRAASLAIFLAVSLHLCLEFVQHLLLFTAAGRAGSHRS